ncbi:MAG: molecular chaperone DnaK [Thaumarchaeota archaeon]|nr:molecular chaperone DnaK [Nitrososphaerota archaeon]
MKEKVLGIDLGTTNSAAAIFEGSKAIAIPSVDGRSSGGKMFPSVVAFTPDNKVIVGEAAKRQFAINPKGTILEIKRKMGTDYKVTVNGKIYTPHQISAFILKKIKNDSETYLGNQIKKAVITVPAHFNDNQRQATMEAATLAGLDVVRIINEPTAACLAYGIDKIDSKDDDGKVKIMVFSFGGGTHDVTTMEVYGDTFKVLATSGDTQTGGADIDNAVVQRLVGHFQSETSIDLRNNLAAMVRLKEAAEKAKIELSTKLTSTISLPFIADINGIPKHFNYNLTQEELEQLALPIVKKVENTIKTVLYDSRLGAEDIDKLILIGGQTKMPLVRRVVEQFMSKVAEEGVDPMECVAIGAAYQGAVATGELNYQLLDVTPLTLGVEDAIGTVTRIIYRNTPIPVRKSQIFTTSKDYQTDVTIHVVQGERPMAIDCVSIGLFDLEGIPAKSRGVPQIEVTFDIDANGILHVSAKEKASGIEQKVTITGRMKLTDEEKKRMVEEAEIFAATDRMRKEEAEIMKLADILLYKAERVKAEIFLPREVREKLDKIASELKGALEWPLAYADYNKKMDMAKAKIVELTDYINLTVDTYEMGEGA